MQLPPVYAHTCMYTRGIRTTLRLRREDHGQEGRRRVRVGQGKGGSRYVDVTTMPDIGGNIEAIILALRGTLSLSLSAPFHLPTASPRRVSTLWYTEILNLRVPAVCTRVRTCERGSEYTRRLLRGIRPSVSLNDLVRGGGFLPGFPSLSLRDIWIRSFYWIPSPVSCEERMKLFREVYVTFNYIMTIIYGALHRSPFAKGPRRTSEFIKLMFDLVN